jgi:Domain of unknown function.
MAFIHKFQRPYQKVLISVLLAVALLASSLVFHTSALADPVETKLTLTVTPVLTGSGTYQGGDVKLDALLTTLDDTPIQSITVSFKANGSNAYSRTTDASGVATFTYNYASGGFTADKDYVFSASINDTTYGTNSVQSPAYVFKNQGAPTGLSASPALSSAKTGIVYGVKSGQEYTSGNINNSSVWTAVSGDVIAGLGQATYSVRNKTYVDGYTVYRASSATSVPVSAAQYSVNAAGSAGVSVVWPASRVDVFASGSAAFRLALEPNYIFDQAKTAAQNSGVTIGTYNAATGLITVSNVTSTKTVTFYAIRISDPLVTLSLPSTTLTDGKLWAATHNFAVSAAFSDPYNDLTAAQVTINGRSAYERTFAAGTNTDSASFTAGSVSGLAEADSYTVHAEVTNSRSRSASADKTVWVDDTAPTISVTGNLTDTLHAVTLSVAATAGPSGVSGVTVNGGPLTGSAYVANRSGSYTFTVTNGAGVTASQTVTVSNIVDVQTSLTFDVRFNEASLYSVSAPGGFGNYTATLLDQYGAPVPDAWVYYTQTAFAPGQRKTDSAGISVGYGGFFPADGDYTVEASFRGGEIDGIYYAPATVTRTLHIRSQAKPVIYDRQVVAAFSGTTGGKIFGLTTDLEYIVGIEGDGSSGQRLIPVTSDTVTGLKPYIYNFRYKQRWNETTGTLYVPSEYYMFALPRADFAIQPDTTNPHVIWGEVSWRTPTANRRDVTEAVPVSLSANTYAYFNVKAAPGYTITRVYASTSSTGHAIQYDPDTGDVTVSGGLGGLSTFTLYAEAVDTLAPAGSISLDTYAWNSFLHTDAFNLFFKQVQQVAITAQDNSNEPVSIRYTLSDAALNSTELGAVTDWNNYAGAFPVSPNRKLYVYAELTDTAGNVTYLRSDGIVLYTDSVSKTERVSFTRGSANDPVVELDLNGNTIGGVKIDGKALNPDTEYSVKNGAVILRAGYLDGLLPGSHTLTVSLRPLGVAFVSGSAPADISIPLTIAEKRASGTPTVADEEAPADPSGPPTIVEGAVPASANPAAQPAGLINDEPEAIPLASAGSPGAGVNWGIVIGIAGIFLLALIITVTLALKRGKRRKGLTN